MFVDVGFKKLWPRCRLPDKPVTFCMLGEVSRYLLKHAYSETHTHTQRCIQSSVCVMENWAEGRAGC